MKSATKKRGPGRPTVMDAVTQKAILDMIRTGAPKKVACLAAGIAESTLYRWLQKAKDGEHPEFIGFFEALEQARVEGVTERFQIIQKAAGRDWRAAAWLLSREYPEEFSVRMRFELEPDPVPALEANGDIDRPGGAMT